MTVPNEAAFEKSNLNAALLIALADGDGKLDEEDEVPELNEEDEVDEVAADEGDVTVAEGADVNEEAADDTDVSVFVDATIVVPLVITVPEIEMGVVTDCEADKVALGTLLDEASTPLIVNSGLALPESPNTTTM